MASYPNSVPGVETRTAQLLKTETEGSYFAAKNLTAQEGDQTHDLQTDSPKLRSEQFSYFRPKKPSSVEINQYRYV